MKITVDFIDSGREPKCPPNPKFPKGVDVDASLGEEPACTTWVPYPSPRCGYLRVSCSTCGQTVLVTVAGRLDDPRSVKLACRPKRH